MFSSEIRIQDESNQTAAATSPGKSMTSTQAKYASTGSTDVASEPKGPYGPNKAHDNAREPKLAKPSYEHERSKPFKLL